MWPARISLRLTNWEVWPIDAEEISGFSMFNSTNYNSGRTGVGTPTMKNMSVGIQLNF